MGTRKRGNYQNVAGITGKILERPDKDVWTGCHIQGRVYVEYDSSTLLNSKPDVPETGTLSLAADFEWNAPIKPYKYQRIKTTKRHFANSLQATN